MNKETKSFQENIRRSFIVHSLVPVIGISIVAMLLFVITWTITFRLSTRNDCKDVVRTIDSQMSSYYSMIDEVEKTVDGNNIYAIKSKIYSTVYKYTGNYASNGNLIIMSPALKTLFTSDTVEYDFLTGRESANWGLLKYARKNSGLNVCMLQDGQVSIAKAIYKDNSLQYYIIYVVPKDTIQSVINVKEKMIYITDSVGWIYTSNNGSLINSFGEVNANIERNQGLISIDGHKYYSQYDSCQSGLKVYCVTDIDKSLTIIEILALIIALIYVAIVIISYQSAGKSSVEYTKDVKKIENAFESVQQGDLDVTLAIDSSREFETIGNDFNEMLLGLKTQIAQNQELAKTAAFSQVKQLESQFNPHFLFNTLDNIRFMAKIDSAAADKMIVSLSGLLRYSIRDARDEVTVDEDLKNLQYYLNILQIRFNKRFAYTIDVSRDIRDCLIPKLILQPLLENAIKYGFGTKEKLSVAIEGYQHKEDIVFVCKDDGVGMEEQLLAELKNQLEAEENISAHLGLYNIHRRIRLMYGGGYGLDIFSEKGEGTEVRIIIPKHK